MKRFGWLFIFLAILAGAFILVRVIIPSFKTADSFLSVNTPEAQSKIYLNDKQIGSTPFSEEKLHAGDYVLKLEAEIATPSAKKVEFSLPLTLTSQTLTSVNYDFGPNKKFSSGDIRSFVIGDGLSIITTPKEAEIWLDGENVGKSPLSLSPNQGIHKLKVIKNGFVTRELEIDIDPSFRLIVEVFLTADPFDKTEKLQEGKISLYDLSTSREFLLSDPNLWAEGVFFFEKKRDLSFDTLIDTEGNQFFKEKNSWDNKIKTGKSAMIGYLGNSSTKGLTSAAKKTLSNIQKELGATKKTVPKKQIQVLSTPTGTLNVRSGPSTSYSIVTKVKPGEKYEYLDESSNWYKIKVGSKQGWVSGQYTKEL